MKAESYISSTEQDGDFAAFFMAVFGGELTWESKTTGLANVRCIKTTEGVSDPTAPSELNTDYIKLEISPYPSIDIVNVNLSNIDLNVYEYTPPFCAKEADAKSTTTINGDILYCDSNLNMWTFTLSTTTYDWGCEGTTVGASSTSNGEYNTNQILYNGTTCSQRPIAASVCDTLSYAGYSDWFLPSEEASLTQNGGLVNDCTTDCGNRCACWDSNAQNARYWTSTELSSIAARAIDFTSFGNVMTNKSNNYVIRCVRN